MTIATNGAIMVTATMMTIATSTAAGIMIVMESAIIGVVTTIATNGAIMVTATMMTTVVLKQPSVTRNISKAHKPAVRNAVVPGLRTTVRKALDQASTMVTAQKSRKPAARNGVDPEVRRAECKAKALDPVSAKVTARKAQKPTVRNGVLLDPALVKPVLDRKVRRFVANNLMASRAVARAAKEASPAIAPKARKPVDRARRTAVPKVDLSRIAVTGAPGANPVQTE